MVPEPAGFEEGSGDVVGEVAEAEGDASEVFEAAVAGAGPVEEREDVRGALF